VTEFESTHGFEAVGADLGELLETLRSFGYDIDPAATRGGAIVARRDLGDRVILLAIDASGRFRVDITWVVGEWPSRDEIAGVPLRIVDAVSRAVTVTGQAARPEQITGVAAVLGSIVDWAAPPDQGMMPPQEPPS
jgi:hypothetical protein